MTHLASLSSQPWHHFLCWNVVLLITVTTEQYWCITSVLSKFSVQVVQAKKGTCFDIQTAASARAALVTAQQTMGFSLWCHPFRMQATSMFKVRLIWNLPRFYGVILGSRTSVRAQVSCAKLSAAFLFYARGKKVYFEQTSAEVRWWYLVSGELSCTNCAATGSILSVTSLTPLRTLPGPIFSTTDTRNCAVVLRTAWFLWLQKRKQTMQLCITSAKPSILHLNLLGIFFFGGGVVIVGMIPSMHTWHHQQSVPASLSVV